MTRPNEYATKWDTMGMWVWLSGMYMADTAWATCRLLNMLMTADLRSLWPTAWHLPLGLSLSLSV